MQLTLIPVLYLIVQFGLSTLLEGDDQISSEFTKRNESYIPYDASVATR